MSASVFGGRNAGIQATTVPGITTRMPATISSATFPPAPTTPPAAPLLEAVGPPPVVSEVATVEGEGLLGELLTGLPEGPAAGGTEVRISGSNLGTCSVLSASEPATGPLGALACSQVIVRFNGQPALVLAANGSEILAFSPVSYAAGDAQVTVTTPAGQSAAGMTEFVYEPPAAAGPTPPTPSVESVTPGEGHTGEFTPVTIRGTNLLPPNVEECIGCAGVVVEFNGVFVPVLEGTPEALRVVAPPLTPGVVHVQVKVGTVASGTSEADRFRYLPPAAPDTTPPHVTVTQPAAGASEESSVEAIAGEAGAEAGDLPSVTVTLFSGTSTSSALESHQVQATGSHWSTTFGELAPGTYTVRAQQSDEAGNVGVSQPVTFTVLKPASGASPPAASFTWFPREPQVSEPVTLVSSSSDAKSPITAFSWSLAPSAPFQAGGPSLTTSFSTPGAHQVQLRVADAAGETTTASGMIEVTAPRMVLMQPFPVVRIVGSDGRFGARLTLLSVQAPSGALITVLCRGRGCPVRRAHRLAPQRRSGSAVVTFPQFARRLPAGVVLLVRVQKAGEIGKYTRFVVRRGRVPARVDACLAPTATSPTPCPS